MFKKREYIKNLLQILRIEGEVKNEVLQFSTITKDPALKNIFDNIITNINENVENIDEMINMVRGFIPR